MTALNKTADSERWYDSYFVARSERVKKMRDFPETTNGLKEFYKTNPNKFISDWGMTFDPRNPEIGLTASVPFVLFPKQVEFIEWVYSRWKNREDGLVEKSRDMGASWLCVSFAVWMFLFHPGTVVGFGSRKEEYVDKLGDPKSLFWKVRKFIELLPLEFKPQGWSERTHAQYMRINNPENGSAIVGEAGDNIGRGNRTSIYFKDESAFYDRPDMIDSALSQTSNCKIDISTPNGNGNAFYRKRHSGKVPVFTFHWRDDPRKNDEWYRLQKAKLDPVIVSQEIDINYNASVSNAYINGDDVISAQANRPGDIELVGRWIVGIDAAHMGNDESVIHFRRGRLNLSQIVLRGVDSQQLAACVEDEIAKMKIEPCAIFVELDGPGVGCYDVLKSGKLADVVQGLHTGARLSDERNYNVKAKMWRRAKEYLEESPVCLPTDPELKAQLSSVKYQYKDGLLLMQSKKEYKKDFGRSSDRADAFVLTFADVRTKNDFVKLKPRKRVYV